MTKSVIVCTWSGKGTFRGQVHSGADYYCFVTFFLTSHCKLFWDGNVSWLIAAIACTLLALYMNLIFVSSSHEEEIVGQFLVWFMWRCYTHWAQHRATFHSYFSHSHFPCSYLLQEYTVELPGLGTVYVLMIQCLRTVFKRHELWAVMYQDWFISSSWNWQMVWKLAAMTRL